MAGLRRRAESSRERMTRHRLGAVLVPPFGTAIRSPRFPTGSNNGTVLFYPPTAPSSIATGSMMRPMSWARSRWPHPPVATSPRAQEPLISDRKALQPTFFFWLPFSFIILMLTTNTHKSRHHERRSGSQRYNPITV